MYIFYLGHYIEGKLEWTTNCLILDGSLYTTTEGPLNLQGESESGMC